MNKHVDYRYDRDSDGTTALMKTSGNGHLQCAKLLLKEGADVNAWNKRGYTALSYTASNDHASVVNVLIRAGADVNHHGCDGRTSLIHAVECGNDVCVNLLIKAGADVNKETRGETALMIAVMLGHERCIELLLKAGADVNNADYDSNTLLHKALAVRGNHNKPCSNILKVVRAVLQSGARVNVLNRRHMTPFGYYSDQRNRRLGVFSNFASPSPGHRSQILPPEPCTGDCERKVVRILLAAGERASDNSGQMVEAVKPDRELTLMELCMSDDNHDSIINEAPSEMNFCIWNDIWKM